MGSIRRPKRKPSRSSVANQKSAAGTSLAHVKEQFKGQSQRLMVRRPTANARSKISIPPETNGGMSSLSARPGWFGA